jgi:pSer/pThr/pTyr-binding forkhead associated (FHA) protein
VLCDGERALAEHLLDADETLIGRGHGCDLALPDDGASRQHAIVSWDAAAGAYAIEDLQSTNGTRVNGKRVRAAPLADGDRIQVGQTQLRFALRPVR